MYRPPWLIIDWHVANNDKQMFCIEQNMIACCMLNKLNFNNLLLFGPLIRAHFKMAAQCHYSVWKQWQLQLFNISKTLDSLCSSSCVFVSASESPGWGGWASLNLCDTDTAPLLYPQPSIKPRDRSSLPPLPREFSRYDRVKLVCLISVCLYPLYARAARLRQPLRLWLYLLGGATDWRISCARRVRCWAGGVNVGEA